jgi:hypothetical protein
MFHMLKQEHIYTTLLKSETFLCQWIAYHSNKDHQMYVKYKLIKKVLMFAFDVFSPGLQVYDL